jgi:hypothetical protein
LQAIASNECPKDRENPDYHTPTARQHYAALSTWNDRTAIFRFKLYRGEDLMNGVLYSALLLTVASPTFADTIPRYDVAGYCQTVSDVSGGSAMIYNGCVDMEL